MSKLSPFTSCLRTPQENFWTKYNWSIIAGVTHTKYAAHVCIPYTQQYIEEGTHNVRKITIVLSRPIVVMKSIDAFLFVIGMHVLPTYITLSTRQASADDRSKMYQIV